MMYREIRDLFTVYTQQYTGLVNVLVILSSAGFEHCFQWVHSSISAGYLSANITPKLMLAWKQASI